MAFTMARRQGHANGMSLRMHTRKHIRLRDFDYSSVNPYFITICTKRFNCIFGEINNGFICLNDIGSIAYQYLMKIPEIRNSVTVGEAIVMPNHVHCILNIRERRTGVENWNQFGKPVPNSVSVIINQYKSVVKKWCDKMGF